MIESLTELMDVDEPERLIDLRLSLDGLYNMIVCNDCCVGLPSEWVPAHLREKHGIVVTDEQVRRYLAMENDAMMVEQVEEWRKSIWVGRAVENIPVVKGIRCNLCQHSVGGRNVMKNHFTSKHRGFKRNKYSEDCKVQLVFGGRLHKYIQVEEDVIMDLDMDEAEDNTEWKQAIDMEFADSMANLRISGTSERGNLRLKNVFIAKTRWDAMVEGLDLQEVVKSAAAPLVNDELHRIILCGRRYIHKTCHSLDKGSVIVKRVLMSGGYVKFSDITDCIGVG